jgi:ATP-binding cassette, subfamily B, bacterial PglK
MHYRQYITEILYLVKGGNFGILKLIIFFLLSSIMDLIGIGLIIPFISMITTPEGVAIKEISSTLSNFGIYAETNEIILLSGVVLICVFTIKSIVSILVFRYILNYCFEQGVHLRTCLMKSYQSLSYIDFIQKNSSQYIYSINNAVELFYREILQPFLKSISEGLTILFIFVFLAWYDIQAVSLLIILLGSTAFLYDRIFRHRLYKYGKMVNEYSTQIVKSVSESVAGYKEIRVFSKEKYFYNLVKEASLKHADASKNSEVIANMPRYIWEVIIITFIVLLSFIAIFSDEQLASFVTTLGLFGIAAVRLIPSSSALVNGFSKLRYGRDTVSMLYGDLKQIQNDKRYIENLPLKYDAFKSLTLKDVAFTYPGAKDKSIDSVSININIGDTIGIMGSSGSGKTTLVDIILGLLNHSSGEIYYNGKLITSGHNKWQSRVAYLPQHAFIIDNTIRSNIALGIDEQDVDEMALLKSIQDAQLSSVIERLPNGIYTLLGERGVSLSGGEMQRISIARALYHDRDILIMDESTSALDKENEGKIMEVIERHKKNKTLIIIAHRLSTLRFCDCIYKIEQGRIVQSGSYNKMVLEKEI